MAAAGYMSGLSRFAAMLAPPKPIGPERLIRRFTPDLDVPISRDLEDLDAPVEVTDIEGGWRLTTTVKTVFHLCDVIQPDLDQCVLLYRADLRVEQIEGRTYLEMRCRVPRDGEYFVKGLHQAIDKASGWQAREIPFYITGRRQPDRIRLSLALDGPGIVEVRNVTLAAKSLPGLSHPRRAFLTALWLAWRTVRFAALLLLNLGLFVVSALLDANLTWWPKGKGPTVGKYAG